MCSRWAPTQPLRIDLFDDASTASATSIRTRSARCEACEQLRLLPAREFPLDEESCANSAAASARASRAILTRMPIYRGVPRTLAPPGIEFYLPLFFERPRAARLPAARTSPCRRLSTSTPALRAGLAGHRRRATKTGATTSSTRARPGGSVPAAGRGACLARSARPRCRSRRCRADARAAMLRPRAAVTHDFRAHRAARLPPRRARRAAAGAAARVPRPATPDAR